MILAGADPNCEDLDRRTPLHSAIVKGARWWSILGLSSRSIKLRPRLINLSPSCPAIFCAADNHQILIKLGRTSSVHGCQLMATLSNCLLSTIASQCYGQVRVLRLMQPSCYKSYKRLNCLPASWSRLTLLGTKHLKETIANSPSKASPTQT